MTAYHLAQLNVGTTLYDMDDPAMRGFVENLDRVMRDALLYSPVFHSRFRHNAVRSLLVLREYRGRRTPVWLQSLRATALLEACREDAECPLVVETMRECTHEALDVPNLRRVSCESSGKRRGRDYN